jgi:hypothetical protein
MNFTTRAVIILKRLVAELNSNSYIFKEQIQKIEKLSICIRLSQDEYPDWYKMMYLLRDCSEATSNEWGAAINDWDDGNFMGAVDWFLKSMEK